MLEAFRISWGRNDHWSWLRAHTIPVGTEPGRGLRHQVQGRVDEHPGDVDEVPVLDDPLDPPEVARAEPALSAQPVDDGEAPDPGEHVERVEADEAEEGAPEQRVRGKELDAFLPLQAHPGEEQRPQPDR